MAFGIGSILATAWTAIGIPLVVRGFQWLGSTIARNKTVEKWERENEITNALRTAVENIGNKTADAIRENPEDWTDAAKAALTAEAKLQANLLLDGKARKVLRNMSDAGVDIIIRNLVDRRNPDAVPKK